MEEKRLNRNKIITLGLVGLVLFVLGVLLIAVLGWLWWAKFWPIGTEWRFLGFNWFWIVKIIGTWAFIVLALGIFAFSILFFRESLEGDAFMTFVNRLSAKKKTTKISASRRNAARPGHLARTLQRYAAKGQGAEAEAYLAHVLPPNWPVSQVLIRTVEELFLLKADLAQAVHVDISAKNASSDLSLTYEDTAALLWSAAERLVAVGATGLQTPQVRQRLERETQCMNALCEAIVEARSSLAELVLGGGSDRSESDRVKKNFERLTHMARSLDDLQDQES